VDLSAFAPIIARVKNIADNEVIIADSLNLLEDFGFDSLDLTEFLYSVEDTFGIQIDYSCLTEKHLRSLGAFRAFLISSPNG